VQALLRCWVRETGVAVPDPGTTLRLAVAGTVLRTEVGYRSAAGWHRFGPVLGAAGPLRAVELAAVLVAAAGGAGPDDDLVGRVADSTLRLARYVGIPSGVPPRSSFLEAEQALILGHPLHPVPKSRIGFTPQDDAAGAPELRGEAPLHWFAVVAAATTHGAADGASAPERLAALAPAGVRAALRPGEVAVAAHFWQARHLLTRRDVAELAAAGGLRSLGAAGPAWAATSSLRTVYRADAAAMLKLSLGVRVTNSRREHRRPELVRGEEMARLLAAGLGAALAAEYPRFGLVRDPAWLAVTLPGETPDGTAALAVAVRDNPFGEGGSAVCVAGLLAERPDRPDHRSALAVLLAGLPPAACPEWAARYVDTVVAPVLWLHAVHGLGLEAHQQNTLVRLDADGWPEGGWYRDNQGYYVSPTRAAGLFALVDGLGSRSGVIDPDPVIDERLVYYVGVNNLLGLVGAVGAAGLAPEAAVLRAIRGRLVALRQRLPRSAVLDALLTAETLPCKANLLTRVAGLDELTGPVAEQSVYVRIPNPFREA
jgi:siderophore synthetase component